WRRVGRAGGWPVRPKRRLVMRSEPNGVPGGKSLTLNNCAAPAGKTRSSPGWGATSPTQFAVVVQLLFSPPPSQVATAGAVRSSTLFKPGSVDQGKFGRPDITGLCRVTSV